MAQEEETIREGTLALQVPKRMYFGREVGVGNRRVISQYALPKRVYLGPTSMDTEMAFIMCNQAKVSPCSRSICRQHHETPMHALHAWLSSA